MLFERRSKFFLFIFTLELGLLETDSSPVTVFRYYVNPSESETWHLDSCVFITR